MDNGAAAVVFDTSDYASCSRRVASSVVDFLVLLLIFSGMQVWFAYRYVPEGIRSMPPSAARQKLIDQHIAPVSKQITILSIGVVAIYIIPFRQLRGGSIGYRLLGIRLVDATGNPPSLKALSKRAAIVGFLIFVGLIPAAFTAAMTKGSGPTAKSLVMLGGVALFMFMAYRSCVSHARRQAVHDKWSGTWMIRKQARAAGRGDIKYHTVFLGTWPIRYVELEAADASGVDSAAVAAPATARPIGPTEGP
ncbi:MAG: RDD family protein [Planctomycetes bacterium]|nr:RDD family protein [Planctomycetota bacterium]